MNRLFRLLAPESWMGFFVRVMFFTALISISNFCFHYYYWRQIPTDLEYLVAQSTFIGLPYILLFFSAATYQLNLQKRLSLLSRKDGLTGLNNRRTFMELAQKRFDRLGHGVLLLLDADHFKDVNDRYGHAAGDRCLEQIAHRLKWNLRQTDVAGRIGGEEFAVFLAGATIEQARVISDRFAQPIPFIIDGSDEHLTITLSVGAVKIDPLKDLDAHLSHADDALYAAKNAGRACTVFWDETLEGHAGQTPTAA